MVNKYAEETLKIEKRANFKTTTVNELRNSTRGLCSVCGRMTTAYIQTTKESITIGEAAHIYGAKRSLNSPRSNIGLSDEFLKSFENGIWVCSVCHKIIDYAQKEFDSIKLVNMKEKAMDFAYDSLKRGVKFTESTILFADKAIIVDEYDDIEKKGLLIANEVSLKGYEIFEDYYKAKHKCKIIKCLKQLRVYYRDVYIKISEVNILLKANSELKFFIINIINLVASIQIQIDLGINMIKTYKLEDYIDIIQHIKDSSYSMRFAMRWLKK